MRTTQTPIFRAKTYRVRIRYSALSQVTQSRLQRHEEKHPSPMKGQFYDLKDKKKLLTNRGKAYFQCKIIILTFSHPLYKATVLIVYVCKLFEEANRRACVR